MLKNGMRPIHPGEVLREDCLKPVDMSANALARQLHVPASRINGYRLGAAQYHGRHRVAPEPLFWWRCAIVAELANRP